MTAREYLRQLPRLQKNIEILAEEIARRRASLESTTVPILGDRVQASPRGDAFADMIAALADKDLELQDMLEIYEELRERMIRQILRMPSELQAEVLRLKYAEGLTLADVADRLHYSDGYIKQVHTAALISFEAKYEQDLVEI